MTDGSSPHVKRASSLSFPGLLFGFVFLCLTIGTVQFVVRPKTYTIETSPTAAKVFQNKVLACPSTPCDLSLHRWNGYTIVVDRAGYNPVVISLTPFSRKQISRTSMPIRLEANVDPNDREQAVKTCEGNRARKIEGAEPSTVNLDAGPCYRMPAVMPWNATRSGHCHVVFDVDPQGIPRHIRLDGCTEDIFKSPTRAAVEAWRYLPAIQNGEPVLRENVRTRMSFKLKNARGDLLPEAPEFSDNPDHTHDIGQDTNTGAQTETKD